MAGTGSSGRIVVGVDGSPESALALCWAARIARTECAAIDVVAAWEFPVNLGWTPLPVDFSPREEIRRAALATVDDAFGTRRPDDLRVITHEGSAAAVLVGRSASALMIVIGRGRRGGRSGARLRGSVGARVAEHAKCPVLVATRPLVPDAPGSELVRAGEARA